MVTAGEDKFMHLLIGSVLCGAGLGIVFSHNGSTGGTDILIAMLNKYMHMNFGRAIQLIDTCIIGSSYLLFHSMEPIVYGIAFTMIYSYACDYVVNGSKQTMQFIIISKEHDKIADMINQNIHRGVTVVPAKGWYSKTETDILIVLARKYESHDILNTIKIIDPKAMVSQTFCHGVVRRGLRRNEINKPGISGKTAKKRTDKAARRSNHRTAATHGRHQLSVHLAPQTLFHRFAFSLFYLSNISPNRNFAVTFDNLRCASEMQNKILFHSFLFCISLNLQ